MSLERTPRLSVVSRTNRCPNPSFEVNTSSWLGKGSTGNTATLDRRTDGTAVVGSASGRVTFTGTTTNNQYSGFEMVPISWTAGTRRTVSGSVRTNAGNKWFLVWIQFYDGSGTNLGAAYGPVTGLTANGWTRLFTTATAPANAATAVVRFTSDNAGSFWAANDYVLLDAVLIEDGSTLNGYFDGGWGAQYGASGDTNAWTGTVGASTSNYLVNDPASLLAPTMVLGWDQAGYDQGAIVHRLLSGAVAVVNRQGMPRSGTLKLWFANITSPDAARAAALSCAAQHRVAGIWAWRDSDNPETAANYVVTGAVHAFNDDARQHWTVEIPFTEVA